MSAMLPPEVTIEQEKLVADVATWLYEIALATAISADVAHKPRNCSTWRLARSTKKKPPAPTLRAES